MGGEASDAAADTHFVRELNVINADKPKQWKADIAESVRAYNAWFTDFAPETYLAKRKTSTGLVQETFRITDDFRKLEPEDIIRHPSLLATLRMSTLPPLAVDRLDGLATSSRQLIKRLETGKLPLTRNMSRTELTQHVNRLCNVITTLLDRQLLAWLDTRRAPTSEEKLVAVSVIADRLSGAWADPVVRNAQETHQFEILDAFLKRRKYVNVKPKNVPDVKGLSPGCYAYRYTIKKNPGEAANIPIDVIIKPHKAKPSSLPILVEAKSAGDYTNPNKRRKEEANKMERLKSRFGEVNYVLFLRGYFNAGYLGFSASDGFDWIWEHRITDFEKLGI